MNITVNEDRTVQKEYNENEGSQNENRITELTFTLPVAYDDFVHKIVFITEDGNYTDYIENNTYILKNNVTKYRKVKSYVWLTETSTNKDFRSELFELEFNYNEDPSDYIPTEEEKSQIELLMEELDELIQEVETLPSMSRQIVEELPTEDIDPTVIYMVLRENAEPNDVYDEYLYIDDDWELIGNTYVDLSGYQQKIDSSHKLDADLVDDTNQTNKFTNATEKANWNAKYSKPGTGIPKTDLASDVQTSLGKADTAIQDISSKQDITDNSLETTNKTVPGAINEVNSIAKGANQAVGYSNYSTMITALNALDDNVYNVGQNIYIVTLEVPDLWVSSVESTSSTYTYTTDAAFISALETNGYVQVGYYRLNMLETQKVDLTNYVTNTDYATSMVGGVVRIAGGYGIEISSIGQIRTLVKTYADYQNLDVSAFIGKGTLDNVLTAVIGDLETILETLDEGSGV